jgi:ribose 5-phosphate isomerase B
MNIAIASDHAGTRYKEALKRHLQARGIAVVDCGTHGDAPVDYPLVIRPVAEDVARGRYDRAIVIGHSGNGEAMAANRVPGVRCALAWNVESARLARAHNNANVLSIGQGLLPLETARTLVDTWLETPFEGGRHERRIRQLDEAQPPP